MACNCGKKQNVVYVITSPTGAVEEYETESEAREAIRRLGRGTTVRATQKVPVA